MQKTKLEKQILEQIKSGRVVMKPKWHFVLGSSLLIISLTGISLLIMFLTNLAVFLVRHNNFYRSWRFQNIVSTFPWWIPLIAAVGFILAIHILKRYDFSYKKNFVFIVIVFVIALILGGVLLDKLGFNEFALRQGKMRGLYQQLDTPHESYPWRRGRER